MNRGLSSNLEILKQRVEELKKTSKKLEDLALKLRNDLSVRQMLLEEYQKWYRAARELMRHHASSGLPEFDKAYGGSENNIGFYINNYERPSQYADEPNYKIHFERPFLHQVALLAALPAEIEARHYSFLKELSSNISLGELEQAEILLSNNFERAAGVVARVALERHIKTIFQTEIVSKSIPKFNQCLIELKKRRVFEERQCKQLAALYNIGNDCAHADKSVSKEEVAKLIREVKTVITHWK